MERRDILRYTALMTGAAISAPLILSLQGCKSNPDNIINAKNLQYFNEDQMRLVLNIVDTILPKTDSPSASEVGVHHTIDQMVATVYGEEDKKSYSKNFAKLTGFLEKESSGKGFHKLSEDERLEILSNLSTSDNDLHSDAKNGYVAIKQQAIAYYLSTEEIATKYLNYLPVPGQYEGCITLESVGGKAWAL